MIRRIFFALLSSFIISLFFPTAEAFSPTTQEVNATFEVSTGRFLFGENEHKKMYMASTTKILTALLVIENCQLDEVVVVPKCAEGVEGSSIYLREGDNRTVEELLYGLMLRSGNDSAVALACHTAGSIEKFADMMNCRAVELGATESNFVNPHGLHHDNHYTTANDLGKITCVAMRNPVFAKIVGTKSIRFEERTYVNKNKMLSAYNGACGVKTGYTKIAGRCLVSSSTRDISVVTVVLNCPNMWEKSKQLMDNAHACYKLYDVFENFEFPEVNVEKGVEDSVKLGIRKTVKYPLTADEAEALRFDVTKRQNVVAPVKMNTLLGNVDVYIGNRLIFSENLYSIYNVRKKGIADWFKELTNENK